MEEIESDDGDEPELTTAERLEQGYDACMNIGRNILVDAKGLIERGVQPSYAQTQLALDNAAAFRELAKLYQPPAEPDAAEPSRPADKLGRRVHTPTEDELAEQNRKQALKEFYNWHRRWNMCPQMNRCKKSIAAIHGAFSDGTEDYGYYFESD